MNLLVINWAWRALRDHSVTFAALFATTLVGIPVLVLFRRLASGAGMPAILVWVATFVVIGALAKREKEWVPDEAVRRQWARGLVFGAIAVALMLTWLMPPKPEPLPGVQTAPLRPRGPAGK